MPGGVLGLCRLNWVCMHGKAEPSDCDLQLRAAWKGVLEAVCGLHCIHLSLLSPSSWEQACCSRPRDQQGWSDHVTRYPHLLVEQASCMRQARARQRAAHKAVS